MIEEKDIDRLKEIFVTLRECQNTTNAFEEKLAKDNRKLAVMEAELKQIKWLVGLVLAGTVANLVNSFFNLIGG